MALVGAARRKVGAAGVAMEAALIGGRGRHEPARAAIEAGAARQAPEGAAQLSIQKVAASARWAAGAAGVATDV